MACSSHLVPLSSYAICLPTVTGHYKNTKLSVGLLTQTRGHLHQMSSIMSKKNQVKFVLEEGEMVLLTHSPYNVINNQIITKLIALPERCLDTIQNYWFGSLLLS